MARMFRAKRVKMRELGISNLKRDRSAFSVDLDGRQADVVTKSNAWESLEYKVLGIKVPGNGYEGLSNEKSIDKVRKAVTYVAKITGTKGYSIRWFLIKASGFC